MEVNLLRKDNGLVLFSKEVHLVKRSRLLLTRIDMDLNFDVFFFFFFYFGGEWLLRF